MKLQNRAVFTVFLMLLSLSLACGWLNAEKEVSNVPSKNAGMETNKGAIAETASNPVDELVALCKKDDFSTAAKHMRYPGMDQSKKNETANYESGDANEKQQIERSCQRFKSMSEVSYTVSPQRMEQGFYVYDVTVNMQAGKTDKQLWAFRKSGEDYVLVDID